MKHFSRQVWRASDGLSEPIVQSIAQDRSGYLWVGTSNGLSRFDGSRFIPVEIKPGVQASFPIYCMLLANDGSLWAGTEGAGLLHLKDGSGRRFGVDDGLTDSFVRAVIQDDRGRIWAGTDDGLFVQDGEHFDLVKSADGEHHLAVAAMAVDAQHNVWAGGSRLVTIEGALAHTVLLPGLNSQNRVKSLLFASNGTLWVGTVGGLLRRDADTFQEVREISATVRTLVEAKDGAVWVGTIGQGLWTVSHRMLVRLDSASMLPSATVLSVFQDDAARMWIGTQNGLVRLEPTRSELVMLPGSAEADYGTISGGPGLDSWLVVRSLYRVHGHDATPVTLSGVPRTGLRNAYQAIDGSLWIGTDGRGAYHRELSGQVKHLLSPDSLPNNFIRVFLQTKDASMWIGTDEGLAQICPDGHIRQFGVTNGLSQFSIRDLLQDQAGDLWVGTDKGLSHLRGGAFVQDDVTHALQSEKVWSLLQDRTGVLWFATRDGGLYRYHAGLVEHYTTAQGLLSNSIYQIRQEKTGRFWLSGPGGIYSLREDELDRPLQNTLLAPANYRVPFEADGAQPYGGRQSSGYVGPDNTVWFATNLGALHVVAPAADAAAKPLVRIDNVSQDGVASDLSRPVRMGSGAARITISYALLFLGSQRGIRFAYKLDGNDRDWVQAGTSHAAVYTNLPPGHFHFSVIAYDAQHPELRSEAVLELVKEPRVYQTWWFRLGSVGLVVAFSLLGYRVHLQRIRAEFRATVKERERIAREMHDTVIQGCTGVSVLLEAFASQEGDTADQSLLQHARTQIIATVQEARDIVWNLRHEEQIDLSVALRALALQASQSFAVPVSYTEGSSPGLISHLSGHEIVMIAREAVANSATHANASLIEMRLSSESKIWTLQIRDNGQGFSLSQATSLPRHYGLHGMNERADRIGASLAINSAPNISTAIVLSMTDACLHRTSARRRK